jgi:hypothetical protein
MSRLNDLHCEPNKDRPSIFRPGAFGAYNSRRMNINLRYCDTLAAASLAVFVLLELAIH